MRNLPTILLVVYLTAFVFAENDDHQKPIIVEHPLDSIVLKDDPVTMKCRASGPNVVYTWYKNNSILANDKNSLVLKDGSLFLVHAAGESLNKETEVGQYYCNASNSFGYAISNTAIVRIATLKKEFRTNPQSVQAVIGSQVTLHCIPPRGLPEPVVSWQRGENTLRIQEDGRLSIHPAGDLVIENVQRSDAGVYKCVATNMVGSISSNAANLIVQEKPYFTKFPENQTVQEGGSVDFFCEASGEPLPRISWKKQQGQMPIGRAELKPRDEDPRYASQTLSIKKVRPSDAGVYICQGKSPAGNVDISARLTVLMSPELSKTPQNLTVSAGDRAEFECEASGDPKPGIVWTKQNDPIFTRYAGFKDDNDRIFVTIDGHLIIQVAQPSDSGVYNCAALNSVTSVFSKAVLMVNEKASGNVFPPPVIEHGSQNQTLMYNDMAVFPCRANGRITPEISWFHNSREIQFNTKDSDGRYVLLSTGALRISNLKLEDSGLYTCRATNADGQATWTASLAVENHTNPSATFHRMDDVSKFPSHPGKPTVINLTSDSVELEWTTPEKIGSSTIVGYLLQYWSPELGNTWFNVLEPIATTRFRVRNLHPGYTYVFVVRAENKQGIGPPSETTEPIVMKQEITEHATKNSDEVWNHLANIQLVKLTSVQSLNQTAIELKWETEHYEPLLDGFYVKWRGPPLDAERRNWINITNSQQTSIVVNDLKPFTYYEFFLVPYHQNMPGKLSNSFGATTMEAPPSLPPTNVRVRMTAINTLHVMWKPPPQEAINGVLKGFRVTVSSNLPDHSVRNITTNERASSITLFNLVKDATYRIKLAAENSAGVGEYHVSDPIVINNATLQRHLKLTADELERIRNSAGFFERNKLQISIVFAGFLMLVVGSLVIFCFFNHCKHENEKGDGSAVLYNQSQQPFNDNYSTYPQSQVFLDARSFEILPNRVFQPVMPYGVAANHMSPPESAYSRIMDTGSHYYNQHDDDQGPLYSVGFCAMNDPSEDRVPPVPSYPPPPLNRAAYTAQKFHNDARRQLAASMDRVGGERTSYPDGHELSERTGTFRSMRKDMNPSCDSQHSGSSHTELSVINSNNDTGRRGMTLGSRISNQTSPMRNILDFVPPPPPLEDKSYAREGFARHIVNGNVYIHPEEDSSREDYTEAEQSPAFSNARVVRNRSRQGYLDNGRRSRTTDEENSQRSSLIAAAENGNDEDKDYLESDRDERRHGDSITDGSFTQTRRIPYMGTRAVHGNSSSNDLGLARQPSNLVARDYV